MAFDAELQVVDSQVVDLSENAEQLSDAGGSVENVNLLTLGRRGFPEGVRGYIMIEAPTEDDAADPIKFVFQCAFDGTNYVDVGTIHLVGNDSAKVGVWAVPLGLNDYRAEVRSSTGCKVRVAVRYADGSVTDDLTYSAYLGGPGPWYSSNV